MADLTPEEKRAAVRAHVDALNGDDTALLTTVAHIKAEAEKATAERAEQALTLERHETSLVRSARGEAMAEVEHWKVRAEQAERWKAEALPVIAGLQKLGRALGLRLGEQITGPRAVEAAVALRGRAEELQKRTDTAIYDKQVTAGNVERLEARAERAEVERDAARGDSPSGFWSQREWEDWSNDLARLVPEEYEDDVAQEAIIERALADLVTRAERAEAALSRVLALADEWDRIDGDGYAAGDGPDPFARTDDLRTLAIEHRSGDRT